MIRGWGIVLLLVSFCAVGCVSADPAQRSPVVLVPGLAGSVLEGRLNRTEAPAWYCSKKTDDFRILWLSLQEASRPICLLDELALFYNATTGRYRNQTGVEIRAVDFGGLGGIDALDPGLPRLTPLYSGLTKAFKDEGYEERKDLFGAPYDFRLAGDGLQQCNNLLGLLKAPGLSGNGLQQMLLQGLMLLAAMSKGLRVLVPEVGYYANLTQLIEHAVESNDGRQVTIIGHSLGCLVSLYFIMQQPTDWLHKHVNSFIAISAPWAGSITALKGSISGDNFDISVIPQNLLRPVQSTAPSGPWLFPTPDQWGDDVLVTTDEKNYTAKDVLDLLKDLNLTQQAAVYPKVHDLTYPLPEVDIRVHCLYGTGKDTDEGYVYDVPKFNASGPPPPKKVVKGPGDGTVNLRSLEACKGLGATARLKSFKDASHMGILTDERLIDEVIQIVKSSKSKAWTDLGVKLHRKWGWLQQVVGAGVFRAL